MAAMKPKVRDDLTVIELDGEAVVYDDAAGKLHHLNPTATIVFNLCDGQSTVREFSEEIAASFGLDGSVVERQVRSLLRDFRKEGFLEGAGPANGHRPSSSR